MGVKKLVVFMARRENRQAFMVLYDIRHRADAEINAESVERALAMNGRGTDLALQKWLVLHDTLVAVGFPGGIFDRTAKVRDLLKRDDTWDKPENQAGRERTIKVVRSLQGLDDKSKRLISAQKATLKDFNKIIRRCVFDNRPSADFFNFELVRGVEEDEAKTEFWVVRRMGVFWEYLEKCPQPEWNTFFRGDWVKRKGVYAHAADDEPIEPRM
jgi:hypothetical protein